MYSFGSDIDIESSMYGYFVFHSSCNQNLLITAYKRGYTICRKHESGRMEASEEADPQGTMQSETPRTQSSCAQRAVCPWNPRATAFSYVAVINFFPVFIILPVFSTLPVFISFTYIIHFTLLKKKKKKKAYRLAARLSRSC